MSVPIEWIAVTEWGRVGVRMYHGQPFVHCEITKWSPSLRREALQQWEVFKTIMRSRGFTKLFSAVPLSDAKVRKWQTLFGQKLLVIVCGAAVYSQEL